MTERPSVPVQGCNKSGIGRSSGQYMATELMEGDAPRRSRGLEEAFLNHRLDLLRFMRARGAGEAADDLLQELWLKAIAIPTGSVADPRSYLFRIANNLMLDRRRAALRAAQRDTAWGNAAGEEPICGSGEQVLIARQQIERAERALAALGCRVAAIFRRYRIDGISQREIAHEMGISLSAVEKDLQKAYRIVIRIKRGD